MAKNACLILAIALRLMVVSCTKQIDSKHGNFIPIEDEANSSERKLIATFKSPSELACSQKCLHHEKCKYKKFDLKTNTCDLLEEFAQEDVNSDVILTKKQTTTEKTSECKPISAGECGDCIKRNNKCDCKEKGVYKSCGSALSANCFLKAVYWILPPTLSKLMAIKCKRDGNNDTVAVFHHDKEGVTLVNGYGNPGSYERKFNYLIAMETIIMIINQSSSCKQYTRAKCFASNISKSWLSGRGGKKLAYWGGGPSNGTGCACGITGTCAKVYKECNCASNDYAWRIDEGFITKKDDLPVTAINVGDTGGSLERFKHTVAELTCVF